MDTNLAAPRLTGNDATRVRIAEDVAGEMGFMCYLGNIEQKISEFDDEDERYSEEDFSEYEYYSRRRTANEGVESEITTSVVDLKGEVLVPKLNVEEQDFVRSLALDSEDYVTDSRNGENIRIYRRSVSYCAYINREKRW
jgi:hypothetical protein